MSYSLPPKRYDFISNSEYQTALNEWKAGEETHNIHRNREFERQRVEKELTNRQFIALATLAAATLTLLIQHVFLSFDSYNNFSQTLIKSSLILFALSLATSISHNALNNRIDLGQSKKISLVVFSWVSVLSYLIGILLLVTSVLITY